MKPARGLLIQVMPVMEKTSKESELGGILPKSGPLGHKNNSVVVLKSGHAWWEASSHHKLPSSSSTLSIPAVCPLPNRTSSNSEIRSARQPPFPGHLVWTGRRKRAQMIGVRRPPCRPMSRRPQRGRGRASCPSAAPSRRRPVEAAPTRRRSSCH